MSNIKVSVQDGNNVTLLVTPQPRVDVRVDKGIAGISGYSGQSGYSGYSGYSGASGTGASGYSGISGYSGYSGISGWSGISGFSGYSGISGFSGYSGSGISGWSGYSGYSGSGISGYSGYSGIGTSGYSGFSGYSGSGISGYSGFSGYSGSGISGYSGFSGYSGLGLSGYSGYSGYSGAPGVGGTVANWGSFWDTTTQTAASANTAYTISFNSADASNYGVTVVSGSRITFASTGIYSLTFSIQFTNSDTQVHDANVWLRKNDSGSSGDVPDTDSKFSITSSHGGVHGNVIGTVNFVLSLTAGDFIELVWSTNSTQVTLETIAAGTSPTSPRTPSVVFTATQVTYTQSGYSGFSGYSGIGTSGYSGFSGYSGYSGSGISGYSGYSGSGISGYSGFSGYSGSGISGYSGFSGYSGSGISGYSGYSGSGISGYSGYSGSGISGYSGYSGSGISGYSGFSGYSGATSPTTYPGAGIAISTGSAWGTSLTAPSGTVVGTTDAQTLTNKRIDPRVSSTTTASSLTPTIGSYDEYAFTALASNLTIAVPTGTPTDGDKLIFRLLDNGTTRTVTFTGGAGGFQPIGVTLTVSGSDYTFATTVNKITYIGCIYNANANRWDVVALTTQA